MLYVAPLLPVRGARNVAPVRSRVEAWRVVANPRKRNMISILLIMNKE